MSASTTILIVALIVSLALAAGCSALGRIRGESRGKPLPSDAAGEPRISVRTDRQVYSVGETVVVTVKNNMDSPIVYYGGCSLRQCGYLGGEWYCIWKECHGQEIVLEPGRSTEMQAGANDHIGARQVLELDCQIVSTGVPHTARSNEFRVE